MACVCMAVGGHWFPGYMFKFWMMETSSKCEKQKHAWKFPQGKLIAVLSRWIWRLWQLGAPLQSSVVCVKGAAPWADSHLHLGASATDSPASRLPACPSLWGSCQHAAWLSEVVRTLVCCPLLSLLLPSRRYWTLRGLWRLSATCSCLQGGCPCVWGSGSIRLVISALVGHPGSGLLFSKWNSPSVQGKFEKLQWKPHSWLSFLGAEAA